LKKICKEYGASLFSGQYFEEAGLIFQKANSYLEALEAFKKAGCWRRIIPLITKLDWRFVEVFITL
jgi:hypothetical protein